MSAARGHVIVVNRVSLEQEGEGEGEAVEREDADEWRNGRVGVLLEHRLGLEKDGDRAEARDAPCRGDPHGPSHEPVSAYVAPRSQAPTVPQSTGIGRAHVRTCHV